MFCKWEKLECEYAKTFNCPRKYTDYPAPYPKCKDTAKKIEQSGKSEKIKKISF